MMPISILSAFKMMWKDSLVCTIHCPFLICLTPFLSLTINFYFNFELFFFITWCYENHFHYQYVILHLKHIFQAAVIALAEIYLFIVCVVSWWVPDVRQKWTCQGSEEQKWKTKYKDKSMVGYLFKIVVLVAAFNSKYKMK